MPYDSLVMAAAAAELQPYCGSRVMKIYQPDRFSITLKLHGLQGNAQVLISAHPVSGRAQLTQTTRENPGKPPLFCMVLRKHLEGGRLTQVEQLGWERILRFSFQITDETGLPGLRELYLEVMGKHSNLILVNPQDHTIIDGVRRYSHHLSRHREVLPGRQYILPPPQNKADLAALTEDSFRQALLEQDLSMTVAKALSAAIGGVSPFCAKELAAKAGLTPAETIEFLGEAQYQALWQAVEEIRLARAKGAWQPVLLHLKAQPYEYYALPLTGVNPQEQQFCASMSQALDQFYQVTESTNRLESRRRELIKTIQNEVNRLEKKIALQQADLDKAEAAETYRQAGELLTTYLYQLEKGMAQVTLPSFEDPAQTVTLELDPRRSPMDNIRHYFYRYNKAKHSQGLIAQQLAANRQELAYVETVLLAAETCQDNQELDEIKEEWAQAGYAKERPTKGLKKKKQAQETPSQPIQYQVAGYTILAGQNNKQNDRLTLKLAAKDDLWLHTQKIPGSHVIIKKQPDQDIPFEVIQQAAAIAAYHSKAKLSSGVPVDYTSVSQVKKPSGAKPGMVIYFQQKTLYVTPGLPQTETEA